MSEDMEELVRGLLEDDRRANSRKVSSATLVLLANMLDRNALPKSGRAYVADVLRAVAEDDPEAILPKPKKSKGVQPVAIFSAVERERRLRQGTPVGQVHDLVGQRHGLEGSTVAKMASQGRRIVKAKVRESIDGGIDHGRAVETMARALAIHEGVIEALLLD